MARTLLTGYPELVPSGAPPDDYQRIQSSPGAFGGIVGQAEERAGAQIHQLGGELFKIYDETASTDAYTKYQTAVNSLLYGDPKDPSKKGYLELTGDEAMQARPQVLARMEDLIGQIKGNLQTGPSQVDFERASRRLQSYSLSQVGRHYDQEGKRWSVSTMDSALASDERAIANTYNDDEFFKHKIEDMRGNAGKKAHLNGTDEKGAIAEADSRAVEARLNGALARRDFSAAKQIFDQYGNLLDDKKRPTYQSHIHSGATSAEGDALGNWALGLGPKPAAVSGDLSDRIIGAESGGQNVKNPRSSAAGPGQFIDSTWLSMVKSQAPDVAEGKTDTQILALKGDKDLSRRMTAAYAGQNKDYLEAQGLPTDDGALYLAHFLGPGGAAKVLSADPATPMSQLVSQDVLTANPNIAGSTAGGVRQLTADRVGAGVPGATLAGAPSRPTGEAAANRSGLPPLTDIWDRVWNTPGYSDEARSRAWSKAKERYTAFEADAARSERIQAQQQKQAENEAIGKYQRDVYSDNPQLTARDVIADPAFAADPKMREHMIGFINNPPGSAIPQPQSWAAALNAIDGIRTHKITDRDQLYDQYMRKVNRPEWEFINKEFDNIRTPGGELMAKRTADLVKRLTPFITKSNPLLGKAGLDDEGDAQLYNFEWALDEKKAEYRKAGKNPLDLLDPSKPDFVGNPEFLTQFQTSMQQSTKAASQKISKTPQWPQPGQGQNPPPIPGPFPKQPPAAAAQSGAPVATAPIPPPLAVARQPGESPADYLKRINPAAAPQPAPPVR